MTKDELVKTEIINQAQFLFKQYGLKKTTMDEIAAACGKAKSTLYHYYKSKEEVFDEVLQKELFNLRSIVNAKVEQKTKLKEQLIAYFITFHKETLNKINLFRVLKQEIKSGLSIADRFSMAIEFEKDYVSGLIESGYDRGELNGISKEDIPWFSEVILVAFLGIVRHTIEKDGEFDEENLNRVAELLIPRIFT